MEAAAYLSARAILRIVLIIVAVVLALYLIYLLRKPLTWLFIALFLAVALSPPVNYLNRYMKRGFAIGLVYLAMFGIIIALAALLIPPIVTQIADVADNAPRYAQDVQDYVNKNDNLRKLEKDYDVTTKLKEQAAKLPTKIGGAAGTLRDIGLTLVNSLFALVTILALTAFMLNINGVIPEDQVIDAQSLPKVKMPIGDKYAALPDWKPRTPRLKGYPY